MKTFICVFLLTLAAGASPAAADECGDAVRDYNSVVIALTDATRTFSECVAGSLGMDSCAAQFGKVQSSYNQYASIVAFYSKQCEVKLR
jgi:hypothetical protein